MHAPIETSMLPLSACYLYAGQKSLAERPVKFASRPY